MPGLVPGIHVFPRGDANDVDGRDVWREDALRAFCPAMTGRKAAPGWILIFRNYSCRPTQITSIFTAILSHSEGRCATSPTRGLMRWTRMVLLTRVLEADGEDVWS